MFLGSNPSKFWIVRVLDSKFERFSEVGCARMPLLHMTCSNHTWNIHMNSYKNWSFLPPSFHKCTQIFIQLLATTEALVVQSMGQKIHQGEQGKLQAHKAPWHSCLWMQKKECFRSGLGWPGSVSNYWGLTQSSQWKTYGWKAKVSPCDTGRMTQQHPSWMVQNLNQWFWFNPF